MMDGWGENEALLVVWSLPTLKVAGWLLLNYGFWPTIIEL